MTRTVLVVEDERPVRELLAASFEASGLRVLQAFHGRHALEVVARERPDLIVSDVMMPLVGGVELCQSLRANPETADIPIVLMSAAGVTAGAAASADAVVAKPFDLDVMDALVHRLLAAAA
ncbi:MAG TPA: response regulator [Chloroflexota bacterium]|nr:response regulator [Chloroflexota bacterium]